MIESVPPQLIGYDEEGTPVFGVHGPDLLRDRLMPLHSVGVKALAERLGEKPSRSSLVRWRTSGYPVDRRGPRVMFPSVTRLKRVYTSTSAMRRWLEAIEALGEEVQHAGGPSAWKRSFLSRPETLSQAS